MILYIYIYTYVQTDLINLYCALFLSFDRYFAKAMAKKQKIKTLYVIMRSINNLGLL